MYSWCVGSLLFIFPLVLGNGHYPTKGNSGSCREKIEKDVVSPPVITYKILSTLVTYKGAVAACAAAGMELASLQTKEKSDAVNAVILASPIITEYWISGSKFDDNKWYWLKGEAMVFTNWKAGEPNNAKGNEDCLTISETRTGWNDEVCSVKLYPVCEKVVAYQNGGSGCKAQVVNIFVGRDQADVNVC
uniref:E-selectin-like isoform X1 n=1 Tax=Diabrotica virgifera virgifera TaxID=50390 RepID=A0A6P7FVV6_DIAVI